MNTERKQGVVKHVVLNRGYGFILWDEGTIFFHHSEFAGLDLPEKGVQVSFEIGPAKKPGQPDQAIKVKPVLTVTAEVRS